MCYEIYSFQVKQNMFAKLGIKHSTRWIVEKFYL